MVEHKVRTIRVECDDHRHTGRIVKIDRLVFTWTHDQGCTFGQAVIAVVTAMSKGSPVPTGPTVSENECDCAGRWHLARGGVAIDDRENAFDPRRLLGTAAPVVPYAHTRSRWDLRCRLCRSSGAVQARRETLETVLEPYVRAGEDVITLSWLAARVS